MKKMKCNLDGTVIVHGVPSRAVYTFSAANNHEIPINEIVEEDIPDLLQKRRAYRSCCGGVNPNLAIFEIIDE